MQTQEHIQAKAGMLTICPKVNFDCRDQGCTVQSADRQYPLVLRMHLAGFSVTTDSEAAVPSRHHLLAGVHEQADGYDWTKITCQRPEILRNEVECRVHASFRRATWHA